MQIGALSAYSSPGYLRFGKVVKPDIYNEAGGAGVEVYRVRG